MSWRGRSCRLLNGNRRQHSYKNRTDSRPPRAWLNGMQALFYPCGMIFFLLYKYSSFYMNIPIPYIMKTDGTNRRQPGAEQVNQDNKTVQNGNNKTDSILYKTDTQTAPIRRKKGHKTAGNTTDIQVFTWEKDAHPARNRRYTERL